MTLLDGLGQWEDLGTVTPVYGAWLPFSVPATQGFTTFRVTFTGEWFTGGWHWAYIRENYNATGGNTEGKWLKIYPSNLPKIIYVYSSPEFGYLNPQRSFQILKAHKHIKTYGGRFNDKVFSVKLEEFSPYPEILKEAQRQTLTAETIQLIAQEVLKLLSPSP